MILGLIGGAGVVAFSVAPELFITLLVGKNYAEGAALLPMLSVVMFLCSINNLLAIYQIALRKYMAIIPVVVGVAALGVGLLFYHNTFTEFIGVLLTANAIVCVLLFINIIVEKKRGYLYGERNIVSCTAKL